jgi:hypothetical protein
MTKYIIDFDAWTTVEAIDEDDAMRIGQVIISACVDALAEAGVTLDMVVRDGGIEED